MDASSASASDDPMRSPSRMRLPSASRRIASRSIDADPGVATRSGTRSVFDGDTSQTVAVASSSSDSDDNLESFRDGAEMILLMDGEAEII